MEKLAIHLRGIMTFTGADSRVINVIEGTMENSLQEDGPLAKIPQIPPSSPNEKHYLSLLHIGHTSQ